MSLFEALRIALAGLAANRLRTVLTMLGIVIGVAAVILLVAFGNGVANSVTGQINSLGADNITITSASQQRGGVQQGLGSAQTLTQGDVRALSDSSQAPDVASVTPVVTAGGIVVQYQGRNWQTTLSGTGEDYADVRGYDESAGAFYTSADVQGGAKVAVIGKTVVDGLFAGEPGAAIGQTIAIDRQPFRVVGTLAAKGSGGSNQDDVVLVPVTAAWSYLLGGGGGKNISQVIVEATSSKTISAAEGEVTQILLTRHRISDPARADFQLQSQQDVLQRSSNITGFLTVLLAAIASISLVVAGIGVMNIMLVTVTERTREIGIRKAIGARRSAILLQFLTESMVLAGGGGVLGVLVGVGLTSLADRILAHSSVPAPALSLATVLVSFGVSVGIGLFFGVYPANRAASLRPIEALRYQ